VRKDKLYVGVDIGGTKILVALVQKTGQVLTRKRCSTPRDASPEQVMAVLMQTIQDVLDDKGITRRELKAIGLTVPGVVDPDAGQVVVTPNMNLSGLEIVRAVEDRFRVPVALGNDVNMGILGERWLGAARGADSAVGIFVGTGVGGGVIVNGELVRGCREAAGEIGHMVMQIGGPLCGCGNRGCLETLASRSAIERDLRAGVAAGRKTILTKIAGKDLDVIKSSVLRRALEEKDALVTDVMRNAAEVLGYACLTMRHVLDPDVIVVGGGVIEACGDFIMPIVQEIVDADVLPGARPGGRVVVSELADDAVILGAVALAQQHTGSSPIKPPPELPAYPQITGTRFGQVTVDDMSYKYDICVRADASVRKRNKAPVKQRYGTSHIIAPEELEKVCKGDPKTLIVGLGQDSMAEVNHEGQEFLRSRGIALQALATPDAIKAYNRTRGRKAALIHVTC